MSRQAKGGVKERVVEKTRIKEPRLWKVLFLNDDVTPFTYVIKVMMETFDKGREEAEILTCKIHNEGIGVVGIYPKSIAEAKKMQADAKSKTYDYPLTIKLERE